MKVLSLSRKIAHKSILLCNHAQCNISSDACIVGVPTSLVFVIVLCSSYEHWIAYAVVQRRDKQRLKLMVRMAAR